MANTSSIFEDPNGTYTGGYTSKMKSANFKNHMSNATRGVIQADIETESSVSLQMRVDVDARWVEVAVYTEDTIQEIVMANYMQVVVTGSAKVWLGETK